jgi:regulation of enolase protein 1 (concanavalin A-like superfamily)
MAFTGTIVDINLRLNGAIFTPTTGSTSAALQIITSDLGNTGTGGTLTDTDSVTINVNALGIFTDKQDIGVPPGMMGSSSFVTPTYTVAGSGADIWNTADQFQFLSRPMTGDGRLTARVVSQAQSGGANNSAKAGVMFRDTVATASINGMMTVTQANGSEFTWRLATGGTSSVSTVSAGIAAPYWVRLTRLGSVLTADRSVDGTTWVQQGSQSLAMGPTILAGLAVTAVNATKVNTVKFDNVKLTTPPTAMADTFTTNEDSPLTVAAPGVLTGDTDPEGDALTAVLVATTPGLTLNPNGSFTYVPPANFSGAAAFTYKANDGFFDSNTVTVNLIVNANNAVPSFTKGANQSVSQGSGTPAIAGWATAISQGTGDSGQLVDFVVTNNNNSLFSQQPAVSAAGTLTYTPAGTTGTATVSVSIHDNGGTANGGSDLSAVQTFTIRITADTTGPTGGSVDASGLVGAGSRYAASATLSLVFATGIDPGGVAGSGNLLKRASATLTSGGTANGTCGAFGSYTTVSGGTDPTPPKSDTVADQACYSYQYIVADTFGNPTTYTSPDIKVDLTAPAAPPSLTHSAFTNTYWSSGATVYYRSAATTGSFTTTSTATDTASGIASYAFPALGTNWTSTPGGLGVNTYSWTGTPAVPGTRSVTATNNATGASGSTSFTPTADDTAPSAGSVTPPNATQTSTTVTVAYSTGTDGGSGLGTRLLQRQSAILGTACGSFPAPDAGWTTAATDPASSPFSDTVTGGFCYKYRYVVADNVGNQAIATSPNVVTVKARTAYFDAVNAEARLLDYFRLDEALASTVIIDGHGGDYNGTYFGTPTMAQSGAVADTGNTAVQFNGINQYGTVPQHLSDNFSIEFWFKSTQNWSYQSGPCTTWWQGAGLIDASVNTQANDFGISLCSGKIIAGVGGAADANIVTPGTYNNGAWHHVVFTRNRNSGATALYVDGSAAGTATGTAYISLNVQPTINIGRSTSQSNYFEGSLDEIALYNTVLTPATVSAHYNAR